MLRGAKPVIISVAEKHLFCCGALSRFWHKAADVIENNSGSLLELKRTLARVSLLRARPDEFRGSFLPLKSNAGGNRVRARQPHSAKNKVYTVNTLTCRLTG